MSRQGTLDFLFVLYAPLEWYPPSRFQVEMLTEKGFRIGVIDTSPANLPGNLSDSVLHFGLGRAPFPLLRHYAPRSLRSLLQTYSYRRLVRKTIQQTRPKGIVAYDPMGFYLVGAKQSLPAKTRLIWHHHELPSFISGSKGSFLVRRSEAFVRKHAGDPDVDIFPDAGRATVYTKTLGISPKQSYIVANCPRISPEPVPSGKLKSRLESIGFPAQSKIIYFQGALSPSRCIEEIITSIRRWPADSIFVCVGPCEDAYLKRLNQTALSCGMANRFAYLQRVDYETAMAYAPDADIGIALVGTPENPNWKYSAGAINKRFEYMAAGLPQIGNQGHGMEAILSDPELGILVNPTDPDSIGNAVQTLLSDPALSRKIADQSRQAHLSTYNYEHQFSPVIQLLSNWVAH